MMNVKESILIWSKFKNFFLSFSLIIITSVAVVYFISSGRLILEADGFLTRDYVTIASSYPARISEILVRPGDKVKVGQKIAIVKSPVLIQTMAELSAEQSKLITQISQLKGQQNIVSALLPVAQTNLAIANKFLKKIKSTHSSGNSTIKAMFEAENQHYLATERYTKLKATNSSLNFQLESNEKALNEVLAAYKNLVLTYNDGIMTSPVSGYVGSDIESVGQVLNDGKKIANIHSGTPFILAYIPENYFFTIEEGQGVNVKFRNQTILAFVERVLPVTKALPPEFQFPNRQRERNQVMRIKIPPGIKDDFAINQKVRISSCFFCGNIEIFGRDFWSSLNPFDDQNFTTAVIQ